MVLEVENRTWTNADFTDFYRFNMQLSEKLEIPLKKVSEYPLNPRLSAFYLLLKFVLVLILTERRQPACTASAKTLTIFNSIIFRLLTQSLQAGCLRSVY